MGSARFLLPAKVVLALLDQTAPVGVDHWLALRALDLLLHQSLSVHHTRWSLRLAV